MNARELVESIRRRASAFSGTLGVWARSLDASEAIEWNAHGVFPSASIIKLPILYDVFRQVGEGRVRLTDPVIVQAEDIVGGSGVLKDLTPGLELSVRDLAVLMIVVSDNTAANLLVDLVGVESVNQSLQALGLRDTVLEHKFFRAPPGAPVNRATPAELGRLLVLVATHAVLTPDACEEMLAILRRQHHTDQITRRMADFDGYLEKGVEPPVRVASKSGSIRGTRNVAALVERDGLRYVIAMMSRDCADRRFYVDNEGALLLADVAGLVDAYFRDQVSLRSHP